MSSPGAQAFSLLNWLDEAGVAFKENSTHQAILQKCPYCGKKNKLYIATSSSLWICFSCGEKGGAAKLVAQLGELTPREAQRIVRGVEERVKVDIEKKDENLKGLLSFEPPKTRKPQKTECVYIEKPGEFKELDPLNPKHQRAIEYLLKRGVSIEMAKAVGIHVCTEGKYANRVVFPVTLEGRWTGFVARDITGTSDKKVLNSSGNFRSYSIWNYDVVKGSEEMVICEGAISAMKCGTHRAVALLGKIATPEQIQLICRAAPKKIIICLDPDAESEFFTLYTQLSSFHENVLRVKMPPVVLSREKSGKIVYKDAGDYAVEEMNEILSKAEPFGGGSMDRLFVPKI